MEDKYFLGGTIVRFGPETVYYYKGQGNKNLAEVKLPFGAKEVNSKTFWSKEEPVIVKNKFITVTVYPDGRVEQEMHTQVKDLVSDVPVKLREDFV